MTHIISGVELMRLEEPENYGILRPHQMLIIKVFSCKEVIQAIQKQKTWWQLQKPWNQVLNILLLVMKTLVNFYPILFQPLKELLRL